MKRHSKFLKIATVLSALAFLMIVQGCNAKDAEEETWNFVNSSSYTITFTRICDDKTTHKMYPGNSLYFTWDGWGTSLTYEPYSKVNYKTDDSAKKVTFIDR